MNIFSRMISVIVYNLIGLSPSEEFKEERKQLLYIRLGVSLFVIFSILCTIFLFSKSELKEWPTGKVVPSILSMEDFGYQDDGESEAVVYAVSYDAKNAGTCYRIALSAEEGRKYLNIKVYHLQETAEVDGIFKHLVEKRYTSFQKSDYGTRHYMPTVKYERAVDQMTKLDASFWDAEEAYAISSIDKVENHLIFVKRKQEILVLSIYGIQMNAEIQKTLLDRIEQLSMDFE